MFYFDMCFFHYIGHPLRLLEESRHLSWLPVLGGKFNFYLCKFAVFIHVFQSNAILYANIKVSGCLIFLMKTYIIDVNFFQSVPMLVNTSWHDLRPSWWGSKNDIEHQLLISSEWWMESIHYSGSS